MAGYLVTHFRVLIQNINTRPVYLQVRWVGGTRKKNLEKWEKLHTHTHTNIFDLQKAFDKVSHKKLLWKIEDIRGLRGGLLR